MKISPARVAAYEVLLRIERDRGFSAVLLPQFEAGLNEKDRALCHEIVLGVLRKKLLLDSVIERFAGSKKIDPEVLTSLRLGAYQLLFLDRIPAHSAVDESVSLVQRAKKSSAKGFVNAILRKVASMDGSGIASLPDSIRTSHPQWLLDRWERQMGPERAIAIAEANDRTPRLAFRRTKRGIVQRTEIPGDARPSSIIDGAFVADRMTAELRELAERGELYFQDEASQLLASLVAVPAGGRFLDVCAAPGGKTGQIAAHSSAMVVAGDLHQARCAFLSVNTAAQGVPEVNVVRYDAERPLPFPEESFDAVLVDAPCTGTGTIRSNPEIRYFLRPADIEELSSKQLAILKNASKMLKPRGVLYYSTCSLEREENEGVIAEFTESVTGFNVVKPEADHRFLTPDGFLRTYPDRDGTDGFFLAVLLRE